MTSETDGELGAAVRAVFLGLPEPRLNNVEDIDLLEAIRPLIPTLFLELAASDPDTRGAPPVGDDPIAKMLGLTADPTRTIDGARIKRLRQQRAWELDEFVRHLTTRGWSVTTRDAFRWERGTETPVPALVTAIAAELKTDPDELYLDHRSDVSLSALFDDDEIRRIIDEWAKDIEVKPKVLQQRAIRVLTAAGRRNSSDTSVSTLAAILNQLRRLPDFGA